MAMHTGLGYRREMADWPLTSLSVDFFEVCPENWIRRDRERLHDIKALGREVRLHGVSLNLGGQAEVPVQFLREVRALMDELGTEFYSDHLAASGDAHQLYDLFPIPFTRQEVLRVSDRIQRAQDVLGRQMAIENATYYTNVGEMLESEFLAEVADAANCQILLDINNIDVNWKNHGRENMADYLSRVDMQRVSYLHVAGHEFNVQLGLYIDTHSERVAPGTAQQAQRLAEQYGKAILLEWDNDVPDMATLQSEVTCLRSTTTCAA
jgi:uncharacterized protein (UPF0276 family)